MSNNDVEEITYTLPSSMTVETVEAQAAELKQLPIKEKARLVIDASQLEAITTPGIQLLLSLEKSLVTFSGELVIKNSKPNIHHTFATLGLEHLLAAHA